MPSVAKLSATCSEHHFIRVHEMVSNNYIETLYSPKIYRRKKYTHKIISRQRCGNVRQTTTPDAVWEMNKFDPCHSTTP